MTTVDLPPVLLESGDIDAVGVYVLLATLPEDADRTMIALSRRWERDIRTLALVLRRLESLNLVIVPPTRAPFSPAITLAPVEAPPAPKKRRASGATVAPETVLINTYRDVVTGLGCVTQLSKAAEVAAALVASNITADELREILAWRLDTWPKHIPYRIDKLIDDARTWRARQQAAAPARTPVVAVVDPHDWVDV